MRCRAAFRAATYVLATLPGCRSIRRRREGSRPHPPLPRPARHAVPCVDQKTAIYQALDLRDPALPLSPNRVDRHEFEYKRCGTMLLYAALNVPTGEVQDTTSAPHTRRDFVGSFREVVATASPGQEIHVILDNLTARRRSSSWRSLRSIRRDAALDVAVFVVAQSGQAVVVEDSAGRAVAGHLHVDYGPRVAAPSPGRHLSETSEALEVRQSHAASPSWNTPFTGTPPGAALCS